jgi:ABC-type transporter Mla subunit MlaD
VGRISKITPGDRDVAVEMTLPHDQKVPANAEAVLTAANVVSDRFIQLSPPYTAGPLMKSGADIPTSRVHTPVEVDEVFSSLDELGKALGPNGIDRNGSLGDAFHVAAENRTRQGAARGVGERQAADLTARRPRHPEPGARQPRRHRLRLLP